MLKVRENIFFKYKKCIKVLWFYELNSYELDFDFFCNGVDTNGDFYAVWIINYYCNAKAKNLKNLIIVKDLTQNKKNLAMPYAASLICEI